MGHHRTTVLHIHSRDLYRKWYPRSEFDYFRHLYCRLRNKAWINSICRHWGYFNHCSRNSLQLLFLEDENRTDETYGQVKITVKDESMAALNFDPGTETMRYHPEGQPLISISSSELYGCVNIWPCAHRCLGCSEESTSATTKLDSI